MEAQGDGAPAGWPLGLPPVTFRMRLADVIGVAEPSSIVTATPSFSSLSSSDLDTESSFSFFSERSITHGSFIGSGRADSSLRSHSFSSVHRQGHRQDRQSNRNANTSSRLWRLMRCSCRNNSDACAPSLAHLLKAERQAAGSRREETLYFNMVYEEAARCAPEANPLFDSAAAVGSSRSNPPSGLPIIEEEGCDGSSLWAYKINNDDCTKRIGAAAGLQRMHRKTQSEGTCVFNCASYVLEPPKMISIASGSSSGERLDMTSCRRDALHRRASTQVLTTASNENMRPGLSRNKNNRVVFSNSENHNDSKPPAPP